MVEVVLRLAFQLHLSTVVDEGIGTPNNQESERNELQESETNED
jgi:hypothetical protein